jgi:effector-binding domain-containing protein
MRLRRAGWLRHHLNLTSQVCPSAAITVPFYSQWDTGEAYAAGGVPILQSSRLTLPLLEAVFCSHVQHRRLFKNHRPDGEDSPLLSRAGTAYQSSLEQIIADQREARIAMQTATFQVEEKVLDPVLIAGVRMKGKYSECGKAFAQIGRSFGRYICGKPLLLHYDTEFKENDADFEACMPIRKRVDVEGISVRELPGGRCISLLHQGPYDQLGRSYAKIIEHIKASNLQIEMPTREIYVKGPGMIFRGNPKRYLTEIQMLVSNP